MNYEDSYVGQLRKLIGNRLLLIPGVRVIVENSDKQILLQKRSDFGLWGLPGGNIEDYDTIEETAIREVKEETGLIINNVRIFGLALDPQHERIVFPNGDLSRFFVTMVYTNEFKGNTAIDEDETLDLQWFSVYQLPETLPNMKRSIEAWIRFKDSNVIQII